MIISCPNCGASFNVKAEALGPNGRTVKCSKCDHRWHATAEPPEPEEVSREPAETAPAPAAAAETAPDTASDTASDTAPDTAPADTDAAAEPATETDAAAEAVPDEPAPSAVDEADTGAEEDIPADPVDTVEETPETGETEPAAAEEETGNATAAEPAAAEEETAAAPAERAPAEAAATAAGDATGDVSDGPPAKDGDEDPAPREDDETVPVAPRAPKTAARKPRRTVAKVLSIFVLLLIVAFGGAAFVMKREIMMWLPASQRLYAMVGIEQQPFTGQGLEIVEPTPKKEIDGNDEILVIEGIIRNVAGTPVDVPLMRGALLNKDGKELHIWTFTAAKSQAAPGESVQYRTEFRNPPSDAETLDITFTGVGTATTEAAAPAMTGGADASQKH